MEDYPTFPTDTAVVIANHAGLSAIRNDDELERYWLTSLKYARPEWKSMDADEWDDYFTNVITPEMTRLAMFQKLSVSGELGDAINVAYIGIDINEEQHASLDMIHKYTNSWTKGEIVDRLVAEVKSNRSLNGKDKANIAETAVTIMNGETPNSTGGKAGKSVKAFMMELTK